MGAYTKLQAINEMLLHAGESTVADLNGSGGVDTSIAESILDQKTLDAQARGLANNITVRTITLDSMGTALLPADAMSATCITDIQSARDDVSYARITTRGWEAGNPYLYNLTDGTKNIKAMDASLTAVSVEVILEVDWEDMDTPVQKDITMQAARQYQMLSQGDGAVDNYLAQLEAYYGAKAKGADTRAKNYNTMLMQNNVYKATFGRRARADAQDLRSWRDTGPYSG